MHGFITKFAKCNKDDKDYLESVFRNNEIANASIECMTENLMRDKGFVKDVFNGSCNFEDVVEYCYSNYDVDVQYPYKFGG